MRTWKERIEDVMDSAWSFAEITVILVVGAAVMSKMIQIMLE